MERSLSSLLFGDYRRRVLHVLLLQPEQVFHVRELARLTGTSAGTLHRELRTLAESGVLLRARRGNQTTYCANPACPIYQELVGIVRKTAVPAEAVPAAIGAKRASRRSGRSTH